MDKELILKEAKKILKIDINHIHGLSHWERVEKFGHYLAGLNGADKKLLSLFAFTHDLGRVNDTYEDFLHGERSAEIAKKFFQEGIIKATDEQMDKLIYACQHHNKPKAQSDDLTIRTCWDSDRLDIWRVGIEPNPLYLYTNEAKNPKVIQMAKGLSIGEIKFLG